MDRSNNRSNKRDRRGTGPGPQPAARRAVQGRGPTQAASALTGSAGKLKSEGPSTRAPPPSSGDDASGEDSFSPCPRPRPWPSLKQDTAAAVLSTPHLLSTPQCTSRLAMDARRRASNSSRRASPTPTPTPKSYTSRAIHAIHVAASQPCHWTSRRPLRQRKLAPQRHGSAPSPAALCGEDTSALATLPRLLDEALLAAYGYLARRREVEGSRFAPHPSARRPRNHALQRRRRSPDPRPAHASSAPSSTASGRGWRARGRQTRATRRGMLSLGSPKDRLEERFGQRKEMKDESRKPKDIDVSWRDGKRLKRQKAGKEGKRGAAPFEAGSTSCARRRRRCGLRGWLAVSTGGRRGVAMVVAKGRGREVVGGEG
ncbi:hypothetical protein B0H15DRAFT_866800, partial [Mycena belliarum]